MLSLVGLQHRGIRGEMASYPSDGLLLWTVFVGEKRVHVSVANELWKIVSFAVL